MMTLCNTTAVGRVAENVPSAKGPGGICWRPAKQEPACSQGAKRASGILAGIMYCGQQDQSSNYASVFSAGWGCNFNPMLCFGTLNSGRVLRCWNMSREGQQSWWWFWNKSPMRRGWGRQDCSSWRKRGSEGTTLLDGCWSLLPGNKW